MKILIERKGNVIVSIADYTEIESREEVSNIVCELKLIELELLKIFEDLKNE